MANNIKLYGTICAQKSIAKSRPIEPKFDNRTIHDQKKKNIINLLNYFL